MAASFFDKLIKDGINRIYKEDLKSQEHYINLICTDVRNMNPDILYKCGAFFVPNENYMLHYFGQDILNAAYDCYTSYGECKYNNYLVMPLMDVKNNIVGLTGFNPFNSLKKKEFEEFKGLEVYKDSGKILVNKTNYFLAPPDTYQNALKNGYIILTDGVFDMYHLSDKGFVSGALLGSVISTNLIAILKLIPNVYLARDNDAMGITLEKKLSYHLPLKTISQDIDKDVDGLLKNKKYSDIFVKQLNNYLKNPIGDFKFRRVSIESRKNLAKQFK